MFCCTILMVNVVQKSLLFCSKKFIQKNLWRDLVCWFHMNMYIPNYVQRVFFLLLFKRDLTIVLTAWPMWWSSTTKLMCLLVSREDFCWQYVNNIKLFSIKILNHSQQSMLGKRVNPKTQRRGEISSLGFTIRAYLRM